MGKYFATSEMNGERPFLCYNCGKQLISNLNGTDYTIDLRCPRCKAEIHLCLREPIPDELAVKHGILVDSLAKSEK